MKEIILDFADFMSVKEAHVYIAERMDFPDYYGANLDALYDCLTDIGEDVKVKIINCDITDRDENALVNVFWDAAFENDALKVEVERRIINEDRNA